MNEAAARHRWRSGQRRRSSRQFSSAGARIVPRRTPVSSAADRLQIQWPLLVLVTDGDPSLYLTTFDVLKRRRDKRGTQMAGKRWAGEQEGPLARRAAVERRVERRRVVEICRSGPG